MVGTKTEDLKKDCLICCEIYSIEAKYTCGHSICYKCAARMLFLYKDRRCSVCKDSKSLPLFYKITNKRNQTGKFLSDSMALYETKEDCATVSGLLKIRCKLCSLEFKSKKDLFLHIKSHSLLPCTTCLDNNHQFWYEYIFYKPKELEIHRKEHILCSFCNIYLFNLDSAKAHCHETHELCTVCDSMGLKLQYYSNIQDLEAHYRSFHYCCDKSFCISSFTYVFAYKSELWAHYLGKHNIDKDVGLLHPVGGVNPRVLSLAPASAESNTRPVSLPSFSDLNSGISNLNISVARGDAFPAFGAATPPVRPSISVTPSSAQVPNFLNRQTISATPGGAQVPSFLNRQIITNSSLNSNARIDTIKRITNNFVEEINSVINEYLLNKKPLEEMVSAIEECVGASLCSKILGNVPFSGKQEFVRSFLVEYKTKLKFPVFTKTKMENKLQPKERTFKILDLKNMKKK